MKKLRGLVSPNVRKTVRPLGGKKSTSASFNSRGLRGKGPASLGALGNDGRRSGDRPTVKDGSGAGILLV